MGRNEGRKRIKKNERNEKGVENEGRKRIEEKGRKDRKGYKETKENRIYIRWELTRKKCKTAILFYCFHTAGEFASGFHTEKLSIQF